MKFLIASLTTIMKIGIDCRKILNPEKGEAAGVGHYTYQLVRYLLKVDKENDYVLFFDRNVEKRRLRKFKKQNVKICFFPFIQYKKFLPLAYSRHLETACVGRENLDVFHSPTLDLPRDYKTPAVITAHDLAIYKFPGLFSGSRRLQVKVVAPYAVKMAKKIIVPSRSTKNDLEEIFEVPAEKIEVIPHGLDLRFFKKTDSDKIQAVKKKYRIPGSYILFLGTLDNRKNITGIIQAYQKLRSELIAKKSLTKKIYLVLAGKEGPLFNLIKKEIKKSLFKRDIISAGYIEPDDLVPLFRGAEVFLFPSFYEGFGLPVIEAMACQVPVITSNVSSLPEVAEGRALLVNPDRTSDITQALFKILTDEELCQELRKQGLEKAREFSWENTAEKTLRVYKEIAKHG